MTVALNDTAVAGAVPAPTPEAIEITRNFIFESLMETADLAASHAVSLREAASRGDTRTCEMHIRQLRACILAAIGTYKDLNRNGGAK
jgi:hypothetical protein